MSNDIPIWKNKDINPLPGEEWNDVPGYDGVYQASTLGRIKSVDRIDSAGRWRPGIIRAQCINSVGVLTVPLYSEGKNRSWPVSQLVFFAFNGHKDDESIKVGHINKNKIDNRLCNLELQKQEKVCKDSWRFGLQHDWGFGQFARLQAEKIYSEFDLENGNRICTRCFEEKPITAFHNRKYDSASGRSRICADCKNKEAGVLDVGKNRWLKELSDRGLKRCPCCDTVKSIGEFPNRKSGIGCYCIECDKNKRLKRKDDTTTSQTKLPETIR